MEIILDVLSISEPDTIATFLRTASKFRDAAQPLLYDSIILKGPQALEGLLESLDAKPQFASRVRHLVARWNEYSEVGTPTYHVLTSLLARTVNLESLVLRGFGGGIHLPSPLARLRDVECDCFPRSPWAVLFLSKIPNLRSIVVKKGIWRWTNIQPKTVSLDRIWTDVLKRVTTYSGPSSILTFLPKESGLKHIQTTDFERISDSLDKLREATDGVIASIECIPLPLHPPSIGFYFPSIQFLGTFQIMTIPPQPVWVRELPSCEVGREALKFPSCSRIRSVQTIFKMHAGLTPLSFRSLQSSDNYSMFGSGPPTGSPPIQNSITTSLRE